MNFDHFLHYSSCPSARDVEKWVKTETAHSLESKKITKKTQTCEGKSSSGGQNNSQHQDRKGSDFILRYIPFSIPNLGRLFYYLIYLLSTCKVVACFFPLFKINNAYVYCLHYNISFLDEALFYGALR